MKSLLLVLVGLLIGVAAFGAVWAATQTGTTDVRITAERLEDGRVELGLQQLGDDGEWGETARPENRFLAADADVGETLETDALTIEVAVEVETHEERTSSAYRNYLVGAGARIATRYNDRFTDADYPELVPGRFLCVIDPNDQGVEALCDGLEFIYRGPVVRVKHDNWGRLARGAARADGRAGAGRHADD